ncbi:hypothetical protein NP493_241g06159 [Ridgeia piscesae]|uniref:P53 and DNA damage-regulated protein 1 n=1 Tax=Ridgeia piscesae TaxID=27915 RepID=A0AAD9UDG9_RIDPI|nr:hypothetical protein NP493_241g06159 [Ridgeia piscesae]
MAFDRARSDKVMATIVAAEEMAEEVLADRQQIVDLDRKRNQTREAIRAVQKDTSCDKEWVCFGNMFLKLSRAQTRTLLKKDYDRLDEEITDIRNKLKPKVNKLRDLEEKEELKGFDLWYHCQLMNTELSRMSYK